MYTALIRSILIYSVTWWPALTTGSGISQTSLTGSKELWMWALSGLSHSALQPQCIRAPPFTFVSNTFYRKGLSRSGNIVTYSARPYGYNNILDLVLKQLVASLAAYNACRLDLRRKCAIRFPPNFYWKTGDVLQIDDIVFFTDGLKKN